ncbi:hypothetical protein [Micromonospora sp. MW-13]|uniref:hypothetical protein n=1 Tax=Micromonospora sp. MW-13 TaxID=2094022 RepID=UPI0014049CF7|nr:hypothetical protein [Micromonospora sp. MW-13]
MITELPPPDPRPLPRRALLGLVPVAATALALATPGRPARAATPPALECLADLIAA